MRYERGLGYGMAVESAPSERALFIRRTYANLAGAILAFIGIEALLVNVVEPQQVFALFGGSPWSLLFVLVAFWGASWVAQTWARSETSVAMQYMGLGLYVLVEAVIILPLLMLTYVLLDARGSPGEGTRLIGTAGILTLAVFGGLTLSVFVTRKDYSFLAPILCVGSLIALGVIIAGIIFGFGLGLFFSFAMVALMSGFILFETSQIMLYHRTDQPVAAALSLFASVATLFFYILRILLILNSRD